MNRRIAWLVALVLAGCDAPPPASLPSAPPAVAYSGGDTLRYHFDWRVEGGGGMPGVVPGALEVEGGLHLAGELVLRVRGKSGDDLVLGATLASLDTAEITVMGSNVLPGVDDLVGREVIFTAAPDGAVGAAYFDDGASALLRRLMTSLLAQTDLRVLPRGAGPTTARVPAGAGLADVSYDWDGDDHWVRRLQGYARLDAGTRDPSTRTEGHLDATVDADGIATRLDGEEILWSPAAGNEAGGFRTHTRFVLERTAIEHGAPADLPELAALQRVALADPPDDAEAARMLAQRFAEGMTVTDVAFALGAVGSGLEPERGFITRATGMLQGWPERADELEPLFAFADRPRARSLLFDVLASGGTPQAQVVMCRLLAQPETLALPERGLWLQRFSFVDAPTPATARFLLDEHERARTAGDAALRRSVLYPIGTVARRLGDSDPALAEELHTRLRDELAGARVADDAIAALAGMGNQGAEADEPLVRAHAASPDRSVRGQVASSLRFFREASARHTVFALLADSEPFVARSALETLDQYQLDATGSIALAAFALGGGFTPDLAGPLASVLGRRRHDDPWVRAALVAMATRSADPDERERIATMLSD